MTHKIFASEKIGYSLVKMMYINLSYGPGHFEVGDLWLYSMNQKRKILLLEEIKAKQFRQKILNLF